MARKKTGNRATYFTVGLIYILVFVLIVSSIGVIVKQNNVWSDTEMCQDWRGIERECGMLEYFTLGIGIIMLIIMVLILLYLVVNFIMVVGEMVCE